MDSLNLIDKAQRIVIIPSSPVDGDAVGSSLALYLILKKLGKKPEINYSFDRFSSFKFLPGADAIKVIDLFKIDFSKYDLAIFLDGGDLSQFSDGKIHREPFILPTNIPVINIDHHPSNSRWAKNLVWDPSKSSVGEMIYEIFEGNVEIDKDIATNLFTAISTDTGHFRYTNTSKRVLEIAGQLLNYGVDLGNLMIRLYQTDSYKVVQFAGYLTSKIQINAKYKYSWFTVSIEEWQKDDLSLEDLKNSVGRTRDGNLRAIDGVDFVFCMSEEQPGYIGGSIRSRNPGMFDLTILAKLLGGGGHREAAGFLIRDKTVVEAEKLVHETIKKHYKEIKL